MGKWGEWGTPEQRRSRPLPKLTPVPYWERAEPERREWGCFSPKRLLAILIIKGIIAGLVWLADSRPERPTEAGLSPTNTPIARIVVTLPPTPAPSATPTPTPEQGLLDVSMSTATETPVPASIPKPTSVTVSDDSLKLREARDLLASISGEKADIVTLADSLGIGKNILFGPLPEEVLYELLMTGFRSGDRKPAIIVNADWRKERAEVIAAFLAGALTQLYMTLDQPPKAVDRCVQIEIQTETAILRTWGELGVLEPETEAEEQLDSGYRLLSVGLLDERLREATMEYCIAHVGEG